MPDLWEGNQGWLNLGDRQGVQELEGMSSLTHTSGVTNQTQYRTAVNPTMTTSAAPVPKMSTTQPSEGTTEQNMTNASRVLPMVYVDDEGLEEQFLMGDEASQEVMDITANRVTTPVDTEDDAAPFNPIYTQRSQQDEEELDLQHS